MSDCKVCNMPDDRKPMCFRYSDHCCELHRKVLTGEMTREEADRHRISSRADDRVS